MANTGGTTSVKNRYFKDEDVTANDVLFVCSMIERVARKIHRRNRDVVNALGAEGLAHELSCAPTSHCENPEKVAADWISSYRLSPGDFDVLAVDPFLVTAIPTPVQMGGVYQRLVRDTAAAGRGRERGNPPRLQPSDLRHNRQLQRKRLLRTVVLACGRVSEWRKPVVHGGGRDRTCFGIIYRIPIYRSAGHH